MKLGILIIISLLLFSCQPKKQKKQLRWLDDISYDSKLDKKDFQFCDENNVYQYFSLDRGIYYEGDKPAVIKHFMNNYDDSKVKKESGLIRVRFIVNCKGEADRFRMLESDLQYNPKSFDKSISEQIMKLTKSMTNWRAAPVDYWQFIIFRIVEGKITKITP